MATITDKGMQAKPGIKDKWLTDSLGRGGGALLARITPAGERLFYFRHTDSTGARKLLPIGPYHPKGAGGLTLAQARERAADLSLTYRDGVKDLRQHFERQAAERERQAEEVRRVAEVEARRVTVRGLFKQWQRSALSPQTTADGTRTGRKDGGEWVRQSFERRVFPAIGDVPADEVTRAQLLAILDDAKAQGVRRTANVLLTDLQQMFRFAAEREIVRASPLAGVSRKSIGGKDTERDRVLSVDEIQQLAASLPSARMSPRSIAAVWLILATAVRVSEAMGANWAHVDLEARTWHLPTTKNQRDHTIHLSDFAVRQFEKLAELREAGSRWVFPSTSTSAARGRLS